MGKNHLKSVAILGATGSIGRNTLDVIRRFPERLRVRAVTGNSRWKELIKIAVNCGADIAVLADAANLSAARRNAPKGLKVLAGMKALENVCSDSKTDIVVSAIVGAAGLLPTLAAVKAGKRVALANKESMVIAGEIMNREASKSGADIIPVDSEHSAIFQCLRTGERGEIARLILTASGGPFRKFSQKEMARATAKQAMNHPTWAMGAKVTIDSATLMNKALEIIEATRLFGVPEERVDVFIHPQSIVHSMVQWADGSVIAQMGLPDMRLPIQVALMYPERPAGGLPAVDVKDLSNLTFEPPDEKKFPGLKLARRAAREGMCYPAALNAANEEAVRAFVDGRISLPKLFEILERAMDAHSPLPESRLENILETDRKIREEVRAWLV